MSKEKRLIQSVEVTEAGIHVLQLQGVLDASTVAELEEVVGYLLSQKHARFVMDLTNVDFISSAGWGVFIGELKKIRNSNGDIKLSGMQPEVLDVFMLLELDHLIEAHPSVDEAIASFLKGTPGTPTPSAKSPSESDGESSPESPAEEEPDPDEIAQERPVDLLETLDNDELEEYEEDFLKLFGDQLPEDEPEDLDLPVDEEFADAEDDAEDVDELDALEALEKLKKITAEEKKDKKAQTEKAAPEPEEAAPSVVETTTVTVQHEPEPAAEETPTAEPSTAEVEAATGKRGGSRSTRQEKPSETGSAAAGSRPSSKPAKQEPETSEDSFSLDNPFDIVDSSDPWLGGVDLDYNQGWDVPSAESAGAGDYSQLLTGQFLDAESAINVDGWMASPVGEGVFDWDDSDNGGAAAGGDAPDAEAPTSRGDISEELREQVRGVVAEFPDFGPSAIRKHLLATKLIDASVTRSMIYRTLVELDLDTRSKRLAFSETQKK